MQTDPKTVVDKLKLTLEINSVDFEKIIKELGQVDAAEKRATGYHFSLDEHVKAMILSMLSNHVSWGNIAHNSHKLEVIFFNYNHQQLEKPTINN